jgi:hypothetical protein
VRAYAHARHFRSTWRLMRLETKFAARPLTTTESH